MRSSTLQEDQFMQIRRDMQDFLQQRPDKPPFQFFRGDSFQILLPEAENALQLARAPAHLSSTPTRPTCSPRCPMPGLPLGLVASVECIPIFPWLMVPAFRLSGPLLDHMGNERLRLQTESSTLDQHIAPGLELLDWIIGQATSAQCEALYWALSGLTQSAVGDILQISAAAVNHRLQAGGWRPIERYLHYFQGQITKLETHA